MPSLPLYQVDAFTDRPFTGNPAAVCPLEAPLPAALMQEIAAENNLSETAFFHPEGDGFALRWFTPTVEVDLCGHATLASALVLMDELDRTRTRVVFHTRSGALPVTRRGDIFVLDLPARPATPIVDPTAWRQASGAIGVQPRELLATRTGTWLAVLATADDVRRLAPDMTATARLGATVCATAPGDTVEDGVDFVSRYFAPSHGVAEDPVTGSSHAALAPFWGARLGKQKLRAKQLSRRGGDLECEVSGDRVLIGGRGRLVLKGTLSF
jgi:PhzF family phenazine biosynthesis protein